MESLKLPVEKVFFVAGIIPGFVALLIFHLAAPGSFAWFFNIGFLGYKTKLCLILLTAFIVGNSMTTFLNFSLNFTGGVIGARMAKKTIPIANLLRSGPVEGQGVACGIASTRWRANTWGPTLMPEPIFNIRVPTIALLPEADRPQAVNDLNREKFQSETDDWEWYGLYNHYHSVTLTSRERDGMRS